MLVLSRKPGQSIYIDDVKVTVVQTDRNRVKIGIEAPQHVRIMREEIAHDRGTREHAPLRHESQFPVPAPSQPTPAELIYGRLVDGELDVTWEVVH